MRGDVSGQHKDRKAKVLGNNQNVGQPLNAYGCSDNRGGLGSCKKCINHKFASQAIEVELNGAELKFAFRDGLLQKKR